MVPANGSARDGGAGDHALDDYALDDHALDDYGCDHDDYYHHGRGRRNDDLPYYPS